MPPFATAAARLAPAASVLQQRARYALQHDNLGDYGRVLAQEWLGSVLGERWAAEAPPRVVARGGWWRRHSLRGLAREVLRLARAEAPARLTQWEFRRLLHKLDRLGRALAAGDLRFE